MWRTRRIFLLTQPRCITQPSFFLPLSSMFRSPNARCISSRFYFFRNNLVIPFYFQINIFKGVRRHFTLELIFRTSLFWKSPYFCFVFLQEKNNHHCWLSGISNLLPFVIRSLELKILHVIQHASKIIGVLLKFFSIGISVRIFCY